MGDVDTAFLTPIATTRNAFSFFSEPPHARRQRQRRGKATTRQLFTVNSVLSICTRDTYIMCRQFNTTHCYHKELQVWHFYGAEFIVMHFACGLSLSLSLSLARALCYPAGIDSVRKWRDTHKGRNLLWISPIPSTGSKHSRCTVFCQIVHRTGTYFLVYPNPSPTQTCILCKSPEPGKLGNRVV